MNQRRTEKDVVIIGGGAAGLIVANEICKQGLNVGLIEQREVGWNHTIRSVAIDTIHQFELDNCLLQEYRGYLWNGPLGSKAQFDYGNTAYAAVDYTHLCRILLDRALRDGLILHRTRALGWTPQLLAPNQTPEIALSDGTLLGTKLLVDASGSAQWAARYSGILRSAYYSLCYGELLEGISCESLERFHFLGACQRYGNGGGWFYPLDARRASWGYSIVVPLDQLGRVSPFPGFLTAREEFQPYAQWSQLGIRQHIEGGAIPVGRIGRFVDHRLLIVGDAAGQAHPWTVEGVRPALENGKACGQMIIQAFEKGRFDRAFLQGYEQHWNTINRERFWRTTSVAEITWSRSDQDWDMLIENSKRLTAQKQLILMRDNPATFLQKLYARGGFARRTILKWIRKILQC
jgi:flavin-dependent dehydrogenase